MLIFKIYRGKLFGFKFYKRIVNYLKHKNWKFFHLKIFENWNNVCRHLILYPLRLRSPFPNDAQNVRPKASLEPNQIWNWLKECKNGKYNLLNKQKSIFGNKITKVALNACTWAAACVRGPKHVYVGTFLRMQLRFQKY